MDEELKNRLRVTLNETKIDKVVVNATILDEVLSIQAHQLQDCSDREISSYIFALSQHLVYLQVQSNVKKIKYLEAKRAFEFRLADEQSKITAKTIKEKTQLALVNNQALQDLEKKLRIKEAEYTLFEKVPEAVVELINAFKKELSIRRD